MMLIGVLLSAVVVMKRSVQVHSKFHEQTAAMQEKDKQSPIVKTSNLQFSENSLLKSNDALDEYVSYIQQQRNNILQEMGGETSVFETMNFPSILPLKSLFMKKLLKQAPLNIVFTGTSVTAGHDNYFNQSYPSILSDILKPIFEKVSIDLSVSNVAMGNNPTVPYGYCTEAIAGDDVDIISWEQAMMCSKYTSLCIEIFMRNAFASAGKPLVLLLDAVPDLDNEKYLEKQKHHMFMHKDKNLMDVYKSTGVHSLLATEAVVGVAANPLFSHKRMMEDDKPFENPKSWHPGPHGHSFVANILAYNYLGVYEEVLQEIQTIVSEEATQSAAVANIYMRMSLYAGDTELPAPLWDIGNLADSPSTGCFTTFQPSKEEFSLQSLVNNTQIKDRRNDSERNLDALEQWSLQLWGTDIKAVEKALADQRGYRDFKFTLVGDQSTGPISFTFEQSQPGQILVCEPPYSWRGYPEGYGHLNESSVISIDGTPMELHSHKLGPCFLTNPVPSGSHSLSVQVSTLIRVGLTHIIFPN